MGRGGARRGNRHRPHCARRRRRGLRARADPRPARPRADRRGGPDAARVRRPGRPVHGRGRGRRRRAPAPRRRARGGGPHRPPLPDLLALQDAARLPRRRRLVHLRRPRAAADARRERGGHVAAAAVRQADGRLAAQHGRLEHLAQALLRAAAALLSVRVRCAQRRRLARGARGTRDGRARRLAGAPPPVDRRRDDSLRVVRARRRSARRRGRRRVARRRHRPLLDARLEERDVGRARERETARPPVSPAPTCRITSTGRSGSRRTGSRRCASRSGCGSTRSASWP